MRIGVNARFLLEGKLEGLGRYCDEVLSRIVKQHPEHQFVFFFDRQYSNQFLYRDNVEPVVLFPPARHPFLWYMWFEWAIPSALKKHKVDVFLSLDSFGSIGVKIPQHIVIHDLAFEHYSKEIPKLVAWFYKKYTPLYCNKANRIVSVSSFTKKDIIKQYSVADSKIDVVLNGVSTDFSLLNSVQIETIRNELSGGKPYFVYVGAMHPRKNIARLLKAFDTFKKHNSSDLKLVVIGRKAWGNEDMEQSFEQMEFKNDVIFTGRLSDKDLIDTLGAAYALTYVPYFEGFGLPIIEAQACGIPVITSDTSSMPEVLGDGGLLVDPMNVGSIVNAMVEICKPDIYDSLKSKAIDNVSRFNWDKTANEYWESVQKMMDDANI